ncbi:MAG: DUF389 domain-containing protein [Chloroflexi bacterium]|nr:DUF389 domain-containing protein [Chloroflexota bacterium]
MKKPTWFRKLFKPLPADKRKEVIDEITPSASPNFDFFLLVVLSCSIATLGLITDSPAVIIGAMLVAPLMSPIIGIGLASITGDTILLRNALSALLLGAAMAIALAALMTLVNNHLPFFSIQELPKEVLARTRPTPIDLIIALAGGIAAAYAVTQPNISAALPGVAIATALMPPLCTIGIGIALNRWDVAGGATLLFVTNTITIAFAALLVFFLRGFSSDFHTANHKLPRNLIIAALLTAFLLVPLSYYSVKFFREASENREINTVVENEVSKLGNVELVELNTKRNGDNLNMVITIRTSASLSYEQVVNLQKAIVDEINRPVSLKISQVIAENLDPLIPPTPTLTPTQTLTSTPGPSPTATDTPTSTITASPTVTMTATNTQTPLPSTTPSATPTPANGEIVRFSLPGLKIYQRPGGPAIGNLLPGQKVTILYGKELYNGLIWIEIQDSDGRIGWLPEVFIQLLLPTPTSTSSPTSTLATPTSTLFPSMTPSLAPMPTSS